VDVLSSFELTESSKKVVLLDKRGFVGLVDQKDPHLYLLVLRKQSIPYMGSKFKDCYF